MIKKVEKKKNQVKIIKQALLNQKLVIKKKK